MFKAKKALANDLAQMDRLKQQVLTAKQNADTLREIAEHLRQIIPQYRAPQSISHWGMH